MSDDITKTPSVGTHGSCVRNSDSYGNGSCVRNSEASVLPTEVRPQRKSPRAEFHDYSGGEYFITICTREKRHYFGKIQNSEMYYTPIGEYCKRQLEDISKHYPYAEIPLFVVMPNHLHAIICISPQTRTHELTRTHGPDSQASPLTRTHGPCVPTERTALSVVIGGFKRAVTLFARRNNIDFGWQSRYHDHIIRGCYDGNKIAEYIENNVAQWSNDCFY